MARKIQHKRGLEKDLPQLAVAEIGFTTDTKKPFIGSDDGNIEIAKAEDVEYYVTHLQADYDVKIDNVNTQLSSQLAEKTQQIETLQATKADKTYVDTQVASVASGSPAGTFATVTDLQNDEIANTEDGKKRIYVVTADGNWYYWNGSAWTAGGQYQSTGIADKSVTPEKTSFLQVSTNLLDKYTFIDGYNFNFTTGEPRVDEEYILSDFIKVKPNTMYYFKNIYYIGRYDVDKNFINIYSPTLSGAAVNSYGAEYIRVSTHQGLYNMAQINEGEELPYEPYGGFNPL